MGKYQAVRKLPDGHLGFELRTSNFLRHLSFGFSHSSLIHLAELSPALVRNSPEFPFGICLEIQIGLLWLKSADEFE